MTQKCKGCGEIHADVDPKKVQQITDALDKFIAETKFNEMEVMVACGVISNHLQQKHKVSLRLWDTESSDAAVVH